MLRQAYQEGFEAGLARAHGQGRRGRTIRADATVDGLVRLMETEDLHEPVNLGNPNEFTIKELAEEVSRICAAPLKIKICPLPQDDPRQRQPDISRAQTLLGWKPTIPLRDGLNRTVDYFKGRLLRQQSEAATAAPV